MGSTDTSRVQLASSKLQNSARLIPKWSPAVLRMELDRWLWKDVPHLSLKKLWEYLCTYGYLSRLRDADVLLEAVAEGLRSRDYFGYAGSVSDGRYQGLIFNQATLPTSLHLDDLSVLVKPEAAIEQRRLDEETERRRREGERRHEPDETGSEEEKEEDSRRPLPPPPVRIKTRYHGSVQLDPIRTAKNVSDIAEEVLQHLTSLTGARVEVTLEIEAYMPERVPDKVVDIVLANGSTLKFRSQDFEEE